VRVAMTATLEPTDKLDAATKVVVNGPEDDLLDWDQTDWSRAEQEVRRLRQRIFTASRDGDLKKVRNLQRLLLRSRSNALVAVRRVAQQNTGRNTAGIDGATALRPEAKSELARWVQHGSASWAAMPLRRVFIPKANGKQRPLGIPVIADRALQAVVLNALEPEWEARFEPRSYGFRPGRGCHDAIEAIYSTCKGTRSKRVWVLDADLAAAFDRIDHHHLLDQLGHFPARERVRAWLKAGVIDCGRFAPTEEGTPQGGVISPLLLNVALHGMENAAGVRYLTGTHVGHTAPDSPVVIRYADDLVALCHSREQAEQVKARLTGWLAPRGLAFNEDKTRVVHLSDGFDFLGFNVRRYANGKLIIKPSAAAVKRFRRRLRTEMRDLRGGNVAMVITRLNPILRGWAAYYRTVVSKHVFTTIDSYLWWLTFKWAVRSHRNKPKRWVIARYYGTFNPSRTDRWIFGDRASGAYLTKLAWTKIVRHQMVDGFASPDDPDRADYWAARKRRRKPPIDRWGLIQLERQRGRCPLCGQLLLHADHEPQSPDEWERWITVIRLAIRRQAINADQQTAASNGPLASRLVHTHCARQAMRRRERARHLAARTRDTRGLA
jgi:RNA-directed DNA polymerase